VRRRELVLPAGAHVTLLLLLLRLLRACVGRVGPAAKDAAGLMHGRERTGHPRHARAGKAVGPGRFAGLRWPD
jgi:hypothetical protein